MTMRIAIRGFVGKELAFEERIEIDESDFDTLLPALAIKHADAIAGHKLHMIEIEFLDETGPNRFFRFGTDPAGMVLPMKLYL